MPSPASPRTTADRPRRRFRVLAASFRHHGADYGPGEVVQEADDPFSDPEQVGQVITTPGGCQLQPMFVDDLGGRWRLVSAGLSGWPTARRVKVFDWDGALAKGLVEELH